MVALFREANTMGIVLKGDDQTKLNYLTATMATLRTSGKFTYLTLLWLFDEGDGSSSGYIMEAFLSYSCYALSSGLKDGLGLYVFL